jgi:hypothetical protein
VGAWSWRRGERAPDGSVLGLSEGRPQGRVESTDRVVPPVAGPAAGLRLGVNVLPDQRSPSRRPPLPAPDAALPHRDAPAVVTVTDTDTDTAGDTAGDTDTDIATDIAIPSSVSVADLHVRRAIALAELSLLAHDQA